MSASPLSTVCQEPSSECPICGRAQFACRFRIAFAGREELDAFLFSCAHCGVAQTYYPSREQVAAMAYPETYYSYSPKSYPPIKRSMKRMLYGHLLTTFVRSVISRWMTMIPPRTKGSVLDVGCGCGAALDIWRELGWTTYGTEISKQAVDICCSRGHNAILTKSVSGLFPSDSFDWVTMDNVLEHIDDPRAVLMPLADCLRSGGTLTICVPNFGGEEAALFGPYWEALDPPHHEMHYTKTSLCLLLKECGFTVIEAQFQPRFAATTSMRNLEVLAGEEKYKGLKRKFAGFQRRKAIHLISATTISEQFGYFLTVVATKA